MKWTYKCKQGIMKVDLTKRMIHRSSF